MCFLETQTVPYVERGPLDSMTVHIVLFCFLSKFQMLLQLLMQETESDKKLIGSRNLEWQS